MTSDTVPAYRPEPYLALFPEIWRPQLLPCLPTALRLSEKRWVDTFRIPSWGQRNCTQFLPAGPEPAGHFPWLRLLWAPAHLSTLGFLLRLLRGPKSGRGRNRNRAAEMSLTFRVETVMLWA